MALVPLALGGCGVFAQQRGDANSAFAPAAHLVQSAERDGVVTVYGTAQRARIEPLLSAFNDRFSGIRVDYTRLTSSEAYRRFVDDYAAGRSPDLIWNSAMAYQIKLINDGYAQSYASSERGAMPGWAVWKEQGYGVTAEPFVVGYNLEGMAGRPLPTTHAALATELARAPDAYRGRIGLLDLEDSGIGFVAYAQDLSASANSVTLYDRLIASRPRVYQTNQAMVDDLRAGRIDIAYNLLGSYVRPNDAAVIRAVEPTDYTLITSRIAFISAQARHPSAARLLLDFMLSSEAETILDAQGLNAARGETSSQRPAYHLPVEVGPALLADLDQMRRQRLLRPWRAAVGDGHPPPTTTG